jgi:hypothetical protein
MVTEDVADCVPADFNLLTSFLASAGWKKNLSFTLFLLTMYDS